MKVKKEKKKKVELPVRHLFLRYGDHLLKDGLGTIQLHQDVVEKMGYVWYGKFGNHIREEHVERINNEKEPVYAYFFKRMGGRQKPKLATSKLYRGRILAVTNNDIRLTDEKEYVPSYYSDLGVDIGFWLKIEGFEKVSGHFLRELVVTSSRSPLLESIGSSNGLMYVHVEKG